LPPSKYLLLSFIPALPTEKVIDGLIVFQPAKKAHRKGKRYCDAKDRNELISFPRTKEAKDDRYEKDKKSDG